MVKSEWYAYKNYLLTMLERFKKITTFVLDVDGVLTDGKVALTGDGEMVRSMNTKDGYAMQLAIKNGYRIVIISGGTSTPVQIRLNKLGIEAVYIKVEDKTAVLQQYMQQHQLVSDEVLYMGDDVPDYDVMLTCGIAAAPADAVSDIKQIAQYISPYKGGEGCVRDVIEKVMKLRGHWHLLTTIKSI
jgi:3-deoxy-D-manno-octulosonate 8-phosphate phosphatase (KDO 8-P phosphatase)